LIRRLDVEDEYAKGRSVKKEVDLINLIGRQKERGQVDQKSKRKETRKKRAGKSATAAAGGGKKETE
jgi:hypothetical protein